MATMIVGVATRATRGHTGRALAADRVTVAIYLLVTASALARVGAGLAASATLPLLMLAGIAWIAAFCLFLLRYGPMLWGQRAAA